MLTAWLSARCGACRFGIRNSTFWCNKQAKSQPNACRSMAQSGNKDSFERLLAAYLQINADCRHSFLGNNSCMNGRVMKKPLSVTDDSIGPYTETLSSGRNCVWRYCLHLSAHSRPHPRCQPDSPLLFWITIYPCHLIGNLLPIIFAHIVTYVFQRMLYYDF